MNKQELIEKYQQIYEVSNNTDFGLDPFSRGEDAGSSRCSFEIVEDLKKLDEPQKVTVPACAGELLDYYRKSADVDLLALLICFKDWYFRNDKTSESEEAIDWLVKHPEKFMKAWIDGYEVEKEPKWAVIGKQGYLTSLKIGKGEAKGWTGNSDKFNSGAIHFEDKEKAEAVALLVSGEIEKV